MLVQNRPLLSLSQQALRRWVVALAALVIIAAGYLIITTTSGITNKDLVLSARVHVPPHLVDYILDYHTLFVVIFRPSHPVPLAVAKQPFTVKINAKTRMKGYTRQVVVSRDQLQIMRADEDVAAEIVSQLASPEQQLYELKVILDSDGRLSASQEDQLMSEKKPFFLGQRDLTMDMDIKPFP